MPGRNSIESPMNKKAERTFKSLDNVFIDHTYLLGKFIEYINFHSKEIILIRAIKIKPNNFKAKGARMP